MTACKNCKTNFTGNFCNNCGQSANTHPINFHYLWHDIQHGVFHFDKGIFFTIRELFVRPGEAIREFIGGKRVSHFKPVAMVFLLGSIYGLLFHYFDIGTPHQLLDDEDSKTVAIRNLANNWIASHYALATMLMLPFVSLSSYWAFYKTGYNLVEHFVMNCFITAQKLVVSLLLFPFLYATNKTTEMLSVISVTMFIDFLLTLWTYNQFFETQSRLKNILKTLLSYFILYVFMAIAIVATAIIMLLKNPHL